MIDILIYFIHILAFLYGFTKNWQTKGLKDGFLSVAIIGIMFSIGWALTGTLAYVIMPSPSTNVVFSRDTLSLVMLALPESVFFYHFFLKDRH